MGFWRLVLLVAEAGTEMGSAAAIGNTTFSKIKLLWLQFGGRSVHRSAATATFFRKCGIPQSVSSIFLKNIILLIKQMKYQHFRSQNAPSGSLAAPGCSLAAPGCSWAAPGCSWLLLGCSWLPAPACCIQDPTVGRFIRLAVSFGWPFYSVGRFIRLAVLFGWPFYSVGSSIRWPFYSFYPVASKNATHS